MYIVIKDYSLRSEEIVAPSYVQFISGMNNRYSWLRFFSPFFGILMCPLTILFIWSVFTSPSNESDIQIIDSTQALQ